MKKKLLSILLVLSLMLALVPAPSRSSPPAAPAARRGTAATSPGRWMLPVR